MTEITVEYLAYVSEKAPINFAMKNTTWLTYGDKNTKTEKSETETYTYGIPVYKYTGIDTALEGAKFILSTNEQPSESNAIKFNPNGTIYPCPVHEYFSSPFQMKINFLEINEFITEENIAKNKQCNIENCKYCQKGVFQEIRLTK